VAYEKGGDGFAYCKSVVDAADGFSIQHTIVFWVAAAVGLGVIAVGSVLSYHPAEDELKGENKTRRLLNWFCVLSSLLAGVLLALAAYHNLRGTDADTARSGSQRLIAQIPPREDKAYPQGDYAAWRDCNLVAAAWRGSHADAMGDAMNRLNQTRIDQQRVSQSAGEARTQVESAEQMTDQLAADAAQAKIEIRDARGKIAEAKKAAKGTAPRVSEQLDAAEKTLQGAESSVKSIESASRAVQTDTAQAASKLEKAAQPSEGEASR
jgi:hypothetical protein